MESVRLVRHPKFKLKRAAKIKFDGSYFKKRMREIRRTLPKH